MGPENTQNYEDIRAMLDRRDQLKVPEGTEPNPEEEIEKIKKVIGDIDPRLTISLREKTYDGTVQVSVIQESFSDSITDFEIVRTLKEDRTIPVWAKLTVSEAEIIFEIQKALQASLMSNPLRS